MSDQNENLEDLVGAPQGLGGTSVFEPGTSVPTVQEHIKLLEEQLAKLRNPAPAEITVAQAKAATDYSKETGYPPYTPEELAWIGNSVGPLPERKNGKLRIRVLTPMFLRLRRIAQGLPPEPAPEVVTAPREAPRSGPASRQIYIMGISADYEGILKSGEYGDVDTFESAAEAAKLLGVTPQALSQAIKKANGKPWTVRGVTMQYSDLYIADDANFRASD